MTFLNLDGARRPPAPIPARDLANEGGRSGVLATKTLLRHAGALLGLVGLWAVTLGGLAALDRSGAVLSSFAAGPALLGGATMGLAAVLLMAFLGRTAGVGGIAARMLPPYAEEGAARSLAFILGLVAAPVVCLATTGSWPQITIEAGPVTIVPAGVLVGFGAVWGSGCTSGHGICGLGRLSRRSLVAVPTFVATAMFTQLLLHYLS